MKKLLVSLLFISGSSFASQEVEEEAKKMVDNKHIAVKEGRFWVLKDASQEAIKFRRKRILPLLHWNRGNQNNNGSNDGSNNVVQTVDGNWIELNNPDVRKKYIFTNRGWEREGLE